METHATFGWAKEKTLKVLLPYYYYNILDYCIKKLNTKEKVWETCALSGRGKGDFVINVGCYSRRLHSVYFEEEE